MWYNVNGMNLENICLSVCAVVETVGHYIQTESARFNTNCVEYKGLNDLVSHVDRNAEIKLVEALSSLLPNAGFITEEKTVQRVEERFNWIIDPLDGTTNFVHGVPAYAVSVALQEYNQLVLGVVYEPNRDELFYTWGDAHSYLNNRVIRVSDTQILSKSLLATGFPYYNFDEQDAYMAVLKSLMRQCHGIRRIGTAAVDLAYTACGRFDAFYEYNLQVWDVAAGALLVKNAGGNVCDFKGGADFINHKQILASNAHLGVSLSNIISNYF